MVARLAALITAFLIAFANARTTRHHLKRGGLSVINPTSPLVMCEVTTFRWNGSSPPYSVGVLVGTASTAPLYHLGSSSSNSYNWDVSLSPNTTITFAVKASSGQIAYSEKLVIAAGNASTCATSWTPPINSTTTANSTAPANSTSTLNGTYASGTSGLGAAGAATTTSKTSDASRLTAGFGLLLAAALLAVVA